ncbi:hypothetical protein SEA_BOOSTSEASON_86 [Mycobacterium phage BoostSeason]|uniref:Uncharacterized protein n=1 Tax=Mycobacterium phage Mufasa TaxID=1718600 RepID=A0A0M5M309_9CAUD|nr:hypothetical protein SEA_MUFASA_86 [Mycobacterium phage Mufasa]ALF00520.1 hypothetical protein SEA_MUFASA_86 [Mycobacterium phage Mufasa]AYN57259.1 hypothetical protein SEA_BOOSTSEASON_86 [Mycobacterium phage BoostSeason]
MSNFTAEDRVAQTILDQIGVPTLMRLGAHKVERYLDAVAFQVKLALPGQTRGRIMRATVDLTAADLYNVRIGFLNKRSLDWVALEHVDGIDAEGMVTIMRKHAKTL